MKEILELLPFIKEIDQLKKIERQALIHNGGRRENTAEHSWHLAMTVMVFHSAANLKLDLAKAVKMALLHDLVEIDAGDTFVYDDLSSKKEKETKAIERLTGMLSQNLGEDFKNLWLEFEANESAEAKFVGAIDRFLPVYSNCLNEGYSWKNHGITKERVLARIQKPISEGLPALWEVTARMLDQAVQDGILKS